MSYGMIFILLCSVIVIQNIAHYLERRDLYNRIMSRDIREYSKITGTSEGVTQKESAHRKAINNWKKAGDD